MKFYRVYYEELLSYEDYIEVKNEDEAKRKFVEKLESEDGHGLVPINSSVEEFEVELIDGSEDIPEIAY